MYNMEEIWDQAPGKCPEIIIQSISRAQNIQLQISSHENFVDMLANWLFPSVKEFPLPNYPTFWKNRNY